MTFSELITAVERDVIAIDATASVKVECKSWYFGDHQFGNKREITFEIWYDPKQEHYRGRTPDEAYAAFFTAVVAPTLPAPEEVLALCDTPASQPDAC